MIGYGEIVDEIRSSYLGEFAISPLRIETAIETKLDINGNIVETKRNTPIYLEPTYDGHTPMGDAFSMAKQLIEAWIDKYPNRPAPIIINISDGAPYSSNGENESEKTISVCNEIMNLNTLDGAPLIFNFHLGSDKNAKVVLPSSKNELKDEMSSFLYEISSTLPHRIKSAAVRYDLIAKDNSKGLISNGNAIDLLKFIQFGSLTNQ
jgi:hypothetical protein